MFHKYRWPAASLCRHGYVMYLLMLCIILARSELRKVLFLVSSVCGFLFVYEMSLEPLNSLCQIHMEDVFFPCSDEFEGQGQRSKAKVTRDKKQHFSALSTACVWFMFGKTSLA